MTIDAMANYHGNCGGNASVHAALNRRGRKKTVLAAFYTLILIIGTAASAQTTRPSLADLGDELNVAVLTIGPGEAVYERFGHNALLIDDRLTGRSVAYNYGLFEFADDFVLRFLQGRMYYWMEGWPGRETMEAYASAGRSVWVQDLNLSPTQRASLQAFLQWNQLPANRTYLYDYYRDNCSTKVRDALDRVLGGIIRQQLQPIATDRTYRFYTQRANANNVLMYTALYFILGQPVDRPLSAWEECFLPEKFRENLRQVKLPDGSPLVAREWTVREMPPAVPDRPPHWLAGFLLVGLLVGAALVGLAWSAERSRLAKFGFAMFAAIWLLLVGAAGAFAAGIWMFTTHVASYCNENLLQMPPIALPLVVLAPALVYGKPWPRRWAVALAWAVMGCSLLGLLLKTLPAFFQVNWQMIALALPAHVGLVVATYLLTKNRPPVAADAIDSKLKAAKKR